MSADDVPGQARNRRDLGRISSFETARPRGCFFLRAAETCRTLAADTTDLMMKSNLQSLAAALLMAGTVHASGPGTSSTSVPPMHPGAT